MFILLVAWVVVVVVVRLHYYWYYTNYAAHYPVVVSQCMRLPGTHNLLCQLQQMLPWYVHKLTSNRPA